MISNFDFTSLKQDSRNFRNTFIFDDKKYYYQRAKLFNCQCSHLLSIFLNKIGVKSVYYDYDEKTRILYCESMNKDDEELIENFSYASNDNYPYIDDYISKKEDVIKKDDNELLSDFYLQYFASSILCDSDKNIGYIIDKNGKYKITPYYDFGCTYLLLDETVDGLAKGYIPDAYIDKEAWEKDKEKFGPDAYTPKDFEEFHNIYMEEAKYRLKHDFPKEIFEDTIKNIDHKIINNIMNFDIQKEMENDYHIYSKESKELIKEFYDIFLKHSLQVVEDYYNSNGINNQKIK